MPKPRSILIYGDTGTYKTSNLYFATKWLLKRYPGEKVRWVTADGGGFQPLIDAQLVEETDYPTFYRGDRVEVFDVSNSPFPYADLHRIAQGYWPIYDKSGVLSFKAVPEAKLQANQVSAYICEGVTSFADVLLNHTRKVEGPVGFSKAWKYQEDGYTITGLQEGHYGIVQQELRQLIQQEFATLPTRFVFYSARINKGDDMKGTTVYGPKGAGSAATAHIPAYVQDCLHFDRVEEVNDAGEKSWIGAAWYDTHLDENTGIPYLAKPRILPELIPSFRKLFPGGYVRLTHQEGLDKYLSVVVDKASQAAAAMRNPKPQTK